MYSDKKADFDRYVIKYIVLSILTFPPLGVGLDHLLHVSHIFEPLLLKLPDLVRVTALVGTKQQKV